MLPSSLQGQKAIKQEIQQPGNLPVGCLRRTVAEWLGKPPQFVRLVAGVSVLQHRVTCCWAVCVQPLLRSGGGVRAAIAAQWMQASSSLCVEWQPRAQIWALHACIPMQGERAH